MLTALATYITLASAWLLIKPARRAAILQANITAIEVELSDDPGLRITQERAIRAIKRRIVLEAKADRVSIRRGQALLLLSFLVFTAAVVLQYRTDQAFRTTSAPLASTAR